MFGQYETSVTQAGSTSHTMQEHDLNPVYIQMRNILTKIFSCAYGLNGHAGHAGTSPKVNPASIATLKGTKKSVAFARIFPGACRVQIRSSSPLREKSQRHPHFQLKKCSFLTC